MARIGALIRGATVDENDWEAVERFPWPRAVNLTEDWGGVAELVDSGRYMTVVPRSEPGRRIRVVISDSELAREAEGFIAAARHLYSGSTAVAVQALLSVYFLEALDTLPPETETLVFRTGGFWPAEEVGAESRGDAAHE